MLRVMIETVYGALLRTLGQWEAVERVRGLITQKTELGLLHILTCGLRKFPMSEPVSSSVKWVIVIVPPSWFYGD